MIQVRQLRPSLAMALQNLDIQDPQKFPAGRQNSLIVPPNSLIGMQDFPAPLGREFTRTTPMVVRCLPMDFRVNSGKSRKIPCRFPRIREFWHGDEFDADCVRHHALSRTWEFPVLR